MDPAAEVLERVARLYKDLTEHASRLSSPHHACYEAAKARHQGDAQIAILTVARKLVRRCYHTLRELG